VSQIAKLFYGIKRNGKPAKSFPRQPRPGEIYDRPPGYDSALQQVKRMQEYGELQFVPCKLNGKVLTNLQYLIMLPKDKLSYQNWAHEIDRGDLYVAFHKTGRLTTWRTKWEHDEWIDFAKQHKVRPDNMMELEGLAFYFFIEVDRGSEFWSDELDTTIENYAGLADSMPQHPFYVLFTLQVRAGMDIRERAAAFRRKFAQLGRKHNFMIAPHSFVVKDPLGEVWDDYRSNEPVSLTSLCG
jgi:hypothetical protein